MNKRKKIIIVPNKISLDVDEGLNSVPYFSLGETLQSGLFPVKNEEFQVTINVIPSSDPRFKIEGGSQYSSDYQVCKNSVYYEKKYSIVTVKLLVEKLTNDHFNVFMNNQYLKLVKLKIDNLYPVGAHLMDILLTKIIENGDILIHGASLFNPRTKSAFLMVAPPDTGKTYTTHCFLSDPKSNFKFLGEDFSYYDSKRKELFCVPLTQTWEYYCNLKSMDPGNIPFLGLFIEKKRKTVKDIFGQGVIKERGRLARIYLLEKSDKNSICRIGFSEKIVKKILTIQRYEFFYYKNPLLKAFDYFNDLKIEELYKKEESLLRSLLKSTEIFEVTANDYKGFYKMIREVEFDKGA